MKKALAGLLIFGMVGAAMVVPAAAAGHHGGGHGGCHRTWTATQTAVCPWSGEDCPWGGDCDGWCVNGGVCDGTGWAGTTADIEGNGVRRCEVRRRWSGPWTPTPTWCGGCAWSG